MIAPIVPSLAPGIMIGALCPHPAGGLWKQDRKSVMSWLLVAPSLLKSPCPARKSLMKAKKSSSFKLPLWSQSQAHAAVQPALRHVELSPP